METRITVGELQGARAPRSSKDEELIAFLESLQQRRP
jgi:hypothetical protein